MARTSRPRPKKKIKKNPVPTNFTPLGGFMPYPPEDCEGSVEQHGVTWTDVTLCSHKCKEICPRRKKYTGKIKKLGWGEIINQLKEGTYDPNE